MKPVTFYLSKTKKLQNKSNVTFPKNTKKYSVKHLLINTNFHFVMHCINVLHTPWCKGKFKLHPVFKKKQTQNSRTEQGWLQPHSKKGKFSCNKAYCFVYIQHVSTQRQNLLWKKIKLHMHEEQMLNIPKTTLWCT